MTKHQTIAEIKEKLTNSLYTDEEVAFLEMDDRVGVQNLLAKYYRQQEKLELEKHQYDQMLVYEKEQFRKGNKWIGGIDEAGRGPLAGPVVAAAVILSENFYLPGLNDSKQLTKQRRDYFYSIIVEKAVTYGIGVIDNDEIDQLNIYQATKKAMRIAIQQLNPKPDHLLIDAVPLDNLLCTSESITKGDQKSVSIAAASIIAKVTRDKFMNELDKSYPAYHFSSNMGYGTKNHLEAIEKYGISPYHRKTFAPIKELQ